MLKRYATEINTIMAKTPFVNQATNSSGVSLDLI